MTGALYFSDEPPHITGHLQIGSVHFQICGVRVNKIRADIKAMPVGKQEDLFDGRGSEGARERDLDRGQEGRPAAAPER
jgi:hypothetical protein